MRDEFVQFFEGAFIQQQVDALSRRQFPRFVFALAPRGASALFRSRAATAQFLYFPVCFSFRSHPALAVGF
jgi:hypothetical protein